MPITNLKLTDRDFVSLRSCPFCGCYNLELRNTHTATYWIACVNCEDEGFDVRVTGKSVGSNTLSEKLTLAQHKKGKRNAVAAWNRRAT